MCWICQVEERRQVHCKLSPGWRLVQVWKFYLGLLLNELTIVECWVYLPGVLWPGWKHITWSTGKYLGDCQVIKSLISGIKPRPMCTLWTMGAPLGWTSQRWGGGLAWMTFLFRFLSRISVEIGSTIYRLPFRASDWAWRIWSPWTWWSGTSRPLTSCTLPWWTATSGWRWLGRPRTLWKRSSLSETLTLGGCLLLMALRGGGVNRILVINIMSGLW